MTQKLQANIRSKAVLPFLKWPGGKRWASPVIVPIIRRFLQRDYYEPFLGGGAVFFALQPDRAILSDSNPHIINVYDCVRVRHKALIKALKDLPVDAQTYYRLRETLTRSKVEQAVRLLYLNRTAFGGIYRVNQLGKFNVPYGGGERTPKTLWEKGLLAKAAMALRGAKILNRSFEESLESAGAGDVVYCDPTYTVVHDNNGFRRYNERNFSWSDQEQLARLCKKAAGRGACVIMSNACHDEIRRLYRPYKPTILTRSSLVSPTSWARRSVQEFLFVISERHGRNLTVSAEGPSNLRDLAHNVRPVCGQPRAAGFLCRDTGHGPLAKLVEQGD